jgi:hypothetical protein
MTLFTERSIWTMIHGIVLGGSALLAFSAALYCMWSVRTADGNDSAARTRCGHLARLMLGLTIIVWAMVLIGTYLNFPPYRATPPEGATDLSAFPRSLLNSNPETAWLHGFAMEIKEHVPWMIAMLMTAVSFVLLRYHSDLVERPRVRRTISAFVTIGFVLTAGVALLGMLINKVAPLA